jgi:pyruvate/2-oxoglutarate dehydrogenase complex dihydrolipoamide dehydrogenase (E3) component
MSEVFEADAVIVGAGQAAPFLAVALAGRGQRVALVEAVQLGGTCINVGCTPTKTLRKSARVAHLARRAAEFGVQVGPVEVDFPAAMARMQQRVDAARAGLEKWVGGQPNIRLVKGWGAFRGRHGDAFELEAGSQLLRAPRVFLNTGGRASAPPIPGLEEVPYLDNVSLLQLRERPRHLLVIGGSYIGLEMAQIFRRLGSEVTVIETAPRITAREDPEVSASIAQFLADEGVRIHAGQPVQRVARDGEGIAVELPGLRVTGSHLLMATGRAPNTEKLNLAAVGLQADARGYLPTNGRLETAVPGIWALGDINARGAFTHTSYHDHEIVLANLDGGDRSADGRTMAYAMFTDPPLGRVGMTEAQARESGRPVRVARHAMKDVSRAKEEGETAGLVKLLVDGETERFLGATFLGFGADEVVQVVSQFMATGASYRVMQQALPIHPTVAEFLPTILGKLEPLA